MDTGTFHKKSSYLPSWTQSEKGKGKLARERMARLRSAMSHVTANASPDWFTLSVSEKSCAAGVADINGYRKRTVRLQMLHFRRL